MGNKTYPFGTFRGFDDGVWVYGALVPSFKEKSYYITEFNEEELSFEVEDESIAISTGCPDVDGNTIFSSIPMFDGKMSKGGDIVRQRITSHEGQSIFKTGTVEIYCGEFPLRVPVSGLTYEIDGAAKIIGNQFAEVKND